MERVVRSTANGLLAPLQPGTLCALDIAQGIPFVTLENRVARLVLRHPNGARLIVPAWRVRPYLRSDHGPET